MFGRLRNFDEILFYIGTMVMKGDLPEDYYESSSSFGVRRHNVQSELVFLLLGLHQLSVRNSGVAFD